MIKSNELRIGNTVAVYKVSVIDTPIDTTLIRVMVVSIGRTGLIVQDGVGKNHDVKYSEIKPIPLTKERLVEFGFPEIEKGLFQRVLDADIALRVANRDNGYLTAAILTINNDNTIQLYEHNMLAGNALIPNPPKHVHQLQNLFFALTGKELEYNESRP